MIVERGEGIRIEFGEMDVRPTRGRIEVIEGCMNSGKSREFIRRIDVLKHSIQAQIDSGLLDGGVTFEDLVVVMKPAKDNRRGEGTVNSRDGNSFPAFSVTGVEDMREIMDAHPRAKALFMDEVQFVPKDKFIKFCLECADEREIRVVIAGLINDFKGENWGAIGELAPIADEHLHLTAACAVCGGEATMTQRLKLDPQSGNWVPANRGDAVEQVGEEQYQARCRKHHQVPD